MKKRILAILICYILLIISVIGIITVFNTNEENRSNKIQIIATIFPDYDFVKRIGGEYVEVKLLLDSGVDSHNYEPSVRNMKNISDSDIERFNNEDLQITIGDVTYNISPDIVDTRIIAKEGYNVLANDNKIIILNTELSSELVNEGLARETVSKVQQLRKNNGYNIEDRIKIYYSSSDEYTDAIEDFREFIMSETLAIDIVREEDISDKVDINDYEVGIRLERVN